MSLQGSFIQILNIQSQIIYQPKKLQNHIFSIFLSIKTPSIFFQNQPSLKLQIKLQTIITAIFLQNCMIQSLTKKGTIRYKQSNKFNYKLQQDKMLNLHHEYFELYDKYTHNNQNNMQSISGKYYQCPQIKIGQQYKDQQVEPSFFHNNLYRQFQKNQHFQINSKAIQDKWLIQENKRVLLQNTRLSKQLLLKNIQNENLKKQISQCKSQLAKIREFAKLQDIHHKDIVLEFTDQIQLILLDNQNKASQLRQLRRIISNLNQERHHSAPRYHTKDRQVKSKSLSKDIRYQTNGLIHQNEEYNYKKMKQLFNSIKEMYKKIMGLELTSLKQLWRWLKSIGQCFSNLKQWKQKTKSLLKTSISFSHEKHLVMLDELFQMIA